MRLPSHRRTRGKARGAGLQELAAIDFCTHCRFPTGVDLSPTLHVLNAIG